MYVTPCDVHHTQVYFLARSGIREPSTMSVPVLIVFNTPQASFTRGKVISGVKG